MNQEIVRSRVPYLVLKSLAALVAHLWFGSIRRTKLHYSFIRRIRNLHSRNISEFDAAHHTKCSTIRDTKRRGKSKFQTPNTGIFNSQAPQQKVAIWNLLFRASLVLGIWCFLTKKRDTVADRTLPVQLQRYVAATRVRFFVRSLSSIG